MRLTTNTNHTVIWYVTVSLTLVCLAVLALGAPGARAADLHVFDKQLSLTGECTPSSFDEAPDPGCPYPPAGEGSPLPFNNPCGTATDRHGDSYVASSAGTTGTNGRIDVFDASGHFVTKIEAGQKDGLEVVCRLAVDSKGRVYVVVRGGEVKKLVRYTPKFFPPGAENEAYGPVELFTSNLFGGGEISGVAVDPTNDHVYVAQPFIREYTSEGDVVGGADEVEQVKVDAEGGTFTLASNGKTSLQEATGPISFDAPAKKSEGAGSIEAALEALPRIDAGNVEVSGGPGGPSATTPYVVTFKGILGNFNLKQMDCNATGLTGGSASCTVTTSTEGKSGFFGEGSDADVWGRNHDVYVPGDTAVRIYDGGSHALKETVPNASQDTFQAATSIAVDQESGDFYVGDVGENRRINHYSKGDEWKCAKKKPAEAGEWGCVEEVTRSLEAPEFGADLALDAPCLTLTEEPCPGAAPYDSPNRGYLFATSIAGAQQSAGHLYAFAPLVIGPPEVSAQAVTQVATTTATLGGEITPNGAVTSCSIEYTSQVRFEAEGFAGASIVPCGEVAAEAPPTAVSVSIEGLKPDATYRFRIVATNHCGPAEAPEPAEPGELEECITSGEGNPGGEGEEVSFATYTELQVATGCPNQALRIGASATLPDCRAYELVSPPAAGSPLLVSVWQRPFDAMMTTVEGDSLVFGSVAGALRGLGGNGSVDGYRAVRDPQSGWQTQGVGPSGAQMRLPDALSFSPDHSYMLWGVFGAYGGNLAIPGVFEATYLRYPDGHYELAGRGSLGEDPRAEVLWITAGASHVIFGNNVVSDPQEPLEPNAPPEGTAAIYDRSAGGQTHVVSLLPEDEIPKAGENAKYLGVSTDGSTVAFEIGTALYERRNNEETLEVASGVIIFEGFSQDGSRAFYLKGGDLFVFDVEDEGTTQITKGAKATVVNISADGTHVYFSSSAVLTGAEKNEGGQAAQAGKDNLYLWDGSSTRFIATLDAADFEGGVNLGKWVFATGGISAGPAVHRDSAANPSRSTADGAVLLFESHADLAPPYRAKGHSEIYRYDASSGSLTCLSCNPTHAPAVADARLQTENPNLAPLRSMNPVANLTSDGKRAFFESDERLVLADADGLTDVYEWKAEGTGGCAREEGCLALSSFPRSSEAEYLYAVTPDGSDLFIESADGLLPQKPAGGPPAIYDARVNGGFAPPTPPASECLGEACQPTVAAPEDPTPASSAFSGRGNAKPTSGRRCGKRKAQRAGKARCARKSGNKRKRHKSRSHNERRNSR